MIVDVNLITGCMLGIEFVEDEHVNHIVVDFFIFRFLLTF